MIPASKALQVTSNNRQRSEHKAIEEFVTALTAAIYDDIYYTFTRSIKKSESEQLVGGLRDLGYEVYSEDNPNYDQDSIVTVCWSNPGIPKIFQEVSE